MPRTNLIEQAHKTCVSATMASIVCGVNPWESPWSLWQRISGETPPREETYRMRRGIYMEAGIIREFTRETKLKVRRPRKRFDERFWFLTEEYGFPMGCLLDGVTVDSAGEAVVEAKTASGFAAADWADEVPFIYYLQVQHQLAVTGWQHGYVCADVGGDFIWRLVPRDDEVIALVTDRERDFWLNHVLTGVPPAADGHEATSAAIRARWPRSEPDYVDVIEDQEVERLAGVYIAQGTSLTMMKTEREKTANSLKTVLEDREAVACGPYKIAWKTQKRHTVNMDALREAHPAIVEEFTVESETRPLKVTRRKDA